VATGDPGSAWNLTTEGADVIPHPPRPLVDDWEWQLRGSCRRHDPELFFHSHGERGHLREQRERRAKQICSSCPVVTVCRDHALRTGELFGIWGGLSGYERAELQRALAS
jgi:WhiB family redox-sensing transcriptional regulator